MTATDSLLALEPEHVTASRASGSADSNKWWGATKAVLWRLFRSDADFVIGDVTEIARPHARKTDYVGTLKDGKTRGFWALVLGTPFRGRVLPFHFLEQSRQMMECALDSVHTNARVNFESG